VPHEITGEYGAGKVILRPASAGTGVIAGSAVRAVLEAAGVTDILSKSIGSNNPHNMAKATLNALLNVETIEEVEAKRNVGVKDYQLKEKE
ncbi:MAG TPA: 30S ribosomal protein S5, partial [bacterium]|nr:30S ribosomal protein S5 [bacterium]